jgi:hypothetical protein
MKALNRPLWCFVIGSVLFLILPSLITVWTGFLSLPVTALQVFWLSVLLSVSGAHYLASWSRHKDYSFRAATFVSFMLIACVILAVSLINIRGLALPLWVDSVHHSAIARLIVEQGMIPTSYRPFAEAGPVYYHIGYHVVIATLSALTGAQVESVMLVFGQMLNVLVCVTIYVLAAHWTGRSVAGLAAMMVPGTLSLMPAYYVTWGRYTQLDGLVILPIAMLTAQRAFETGAKRQIVLAGVLAGGLLLVHYRVTYFYAAFVIAYLLWHAVARFRRHDSIAPLLRRVIAVGAVATVVSAPWLWRLVTTVVLPVDTFLTRITGNTEYNSIPWDLVTGDNNLWLYAVAALGIALAIWQRRSQVFIILLWVVLTIVPVNPTLLGAPPTWLVNNFSLVISMFFPLALLIAFAVSGVLDVVERHVSPAFSKNLNQAAPIALVLLALVTAPARLHIVNPVTVLATQDDVTALNWIRAQTPPDSTFLVNERLWQGVTFAGTDGGYWIPNLTGRRTTMPIVFYTQGSPQYVEQVNSLARLIESGPDPADPAFLRDLQARGVTHVYIGVKGGPLSLPRFLQSEHYAEVYAQGGVHIFEIRY